MGNEHKVIELQRDTVLTGYKALILNNVEIVTFSTDCTSTPTYVLDAILGNETELAILEHTTDTAGATEIIFALFDLLGLRFTPRLRDIGSRC